MSDIKYLGVQGLEELIILTQNGLAKKADTLQFDAMPDPTKYIGKIVQYVGVSDISFTRSHFYYSNGIKWTEENASGGQTPKIEIVTALPSWADSDPQVLYILKNAADITMNFYVKNPSVNGAWFTVEKSVSFAVVSSLPQWADADSSIVYFKANGNGLVGYNLVGYIKNIHTIDAWYTFGEKPQIDTVLSATSENPLQNKIIFTEIQSLRAQANMILTASQDADKKLQDDIEANANALGLLDAEVSGIHDDIAASQDADKKLQDGIEANANALGLLDAKVSGMHIDTAISATSENPVQNKVIFTEIQSLGGAVRAAHDTIAANKNASQNADKKLQKGIDANANALGLLDTKVSGMHDDIATNQIEIEAIKRNLLDTYATQRYVQNQNLLSDYKSIVLSSSASAPTRMEYDGYVTVIDNDASTGVRLYINGVCASVAEERNDRDTAVTVFVAKNDDLYLLYPSNRYDAKARFYELRDYTNRPPKA